MTTLSYAHGPGDDPAAGQTIGEALAAHRRRARRPRRGRLVPRGHPADLRASSADRVERVALALLAAGVERGDRVGIWAPNCAEWVVVQYATARVGAILVNVNPSYRQHELDFVLRAVGPVAAAVRARASRASTTGRWSRPPTRPACARAIELGGADWEAFLAGARRRRRRRAGGARGRARRSTSRSTSSTRRAPRASRRARRSRTTTSSTTASSSARCSATTQTDRICVPVPFYHCFGMVLGQPRGRHARQLRRDPVRGVRPARRARGRRRRALHVAVRRADDVHRDAGRSRSSSGSTCRSLRTGIMAGSPCPVEVMRRDAQRAPHGRGHDLLRHDRDVAGVDADAARRPARRSASARSARSTRTSR